MVVFLTSSPTGPLDGSMDLTGLDERNWFVDNLREVWCPDARCLMIAASPEEYEANDEMVDFFAEAVEHSGFSVSAFDLLDGRSEDISREELFSYDVLILSGGHVPTENEFFHRIGLRELLEGFPGVIIGISAGSMNSADTVYAQPENPGEATDPDYERYLEGLGLTDTMILPHYQAVKDNELDGMRLYEEITCGDSYGNQFLVLPDGSYLMSVDGAESVWGEAYCFSDGELELICEDGEHIDLS